MTRSPVIRSRRGFTLLELLMATAIMAVLSVTLYSAMRTGFKARDRALATVGSARSGEIAMDMIRRDIESAMPPKGVISNAFLGEEGTEVRGTSAVRFFLVGTTPVTTTDPTSAGVSIGSRGPSSWERTDPTALGGIERVELLVRATDSALVRRVTRNVLARTEPEPQEQLICRNVSTFTIRYYDGVQWLDAWDSTQYGDILPMAVEVTLELTGSRDPTRAGNADPRDTTNASAYRTSRTFLIPCRDEAALTQGVTQ